MGDIALIEALGIAPAGVMPDMNRICPSLPGIAPRPGARKRLYDERTVIGLMLGQVFDRNSPCKDAVRQAQILLGLDASSSTAAYCRARKRVRPEAVYGLSEALSAEADSLSEPAGFRGIWALDGTTFWASDTDANRARWPYAPGQKPGCGTPVVGVLAAHSLSGGGSKALAVAGCRAHDFRLFAEAAPRLEAGCLYVEDRAFCSYAAVGIHLGAKSDAIIRGKKWCCKRGRDDRIIGDGDRVTTWYKGKYRSTKAVPPDKMAELPETVRVRIVEAKIGVRGFRDENLVLVTTLLDPVKYPKAAILAWYLRRWEIEVSFRDMKTTLRYNFIRGRTPDMVLLEIAVLTLAYNFMRYVIARGEPGAGKTRRGIASTAAAVKAFAAGITAVGRAGRSCARAFKRLVKAVAADVLPRRKSGTYERRVKHRPCKYSLLTKPRAEYKARKGDETLS